ncbi:MAG: type VII toxin-antitoxin system HepT family RNase toxin [Campylobacterales bacterium]
MLLDDVIINKIESMHRCIVRIKEEYEGFEDEFELNYTKQDSVVLNLERASQACIDIASHITRVYKLGVPKSTRELFVLLEENKFISKKSSENMQKMVGFRNIAVHDYQNLNLDILVNIITKNLGDFESFIEDIKGS